MKRPLVPVALAYAAGLLGAELVQPRLLVLLACALVLLLAAGSSATRRAFLLWPLLILVGWANLVSRTAILSPVDLRLVAGTNAALVTVRGRLIATPTERVFERDAVEAWRTLAEISVIEIQRDGRWQPAVGRVMSTTTGQLPNSYFSGQSVEVAGVLLQPGFPLAEGLFDYRTYLARQGIYYQLRCDSTNDWRLSAGARARRPFSDRFLDWAQATLARGLPSEARDQPLHLLWAMTLGWRPALTNEVSEPFMRSGTMHIFAVLDFSLLYCSSQPMKTAFSYVRLSARRQTKGTGQTRQLDKAKQVCKEKGWILSPQTFQDLGVSGFKGANRLKGALSEFIKLNNTGKLGSNEPVLLLEGFDRYSRQNIDEAEPAFLDLLRSGVDIHILLTGKTFTKEHTKDLASRIEILVAIKQAHDFSALLSARIRSTQAIRDKRINAGEVVKTSNVPRYYRFDKATNTYCQTEAAEVVKRIINDYLKGHTLYGISQALNKEQVPCIGYVKGVKWSRMTIKGILTTPALYGSHKNNPHFFADPITDKSTFDRIQVLLKQNSGNRGRFGSDFINIFRGLAKCPVCHGSMSAGVQFLNSNGKPKKEPYRYLRCSSVSNSMPCSNRHNMDLRKIETEFFSVFLKQDPETLFNQPADTKAEKEMTKLQSERDKVSKNINTLLEVGIDLPELKARLTELKKQREALNTQMQTLQLSQSARTVNTENVVNFKRLFSKIWADRITKDNQDQFVKGLERLKIKLQDNETRLQIRTMLPSFIGRIDFLTTRNEWLVYDLNGKHIYTSLP